MENESLALGQKKGQTSQQGECSHFIGLTTVAIQFDDIVRWEYIGLYIGIRRTQLLVRGKTLGKTPGNRDGSF